MQRGSQGLVGARSSGQARCTEGTLELVGGSLGLPKAPSAPLPGRGCCSGSWGTTHVIPDPQTTQTASKMGLTKQQDFTKDLNN